MHCNGKTFGRIQQKGRFTVNGKKYYGKNIWVAFRDNKIDKIYVYPHDKALKFVEDGITNKNVKFWQTKHRHWNTITKRNATFLKDYELK